MSSNDKIPVLSFDWSSSDGVWSAINEFKEGDYTAHECLVGNLIPHCGGLDCGSCVWEADSEGQPKNIEATMLSIGKWYDNGEGYSDFEPLPIANTRKLWDNIRKLMEIES